MFTAEEKIRLSLTGNPFSEPFFQHEGEEVIRWLSGGTLPDAYVTFHRRGEIIEVHCPTCKAKLGQFPYHYGGNTGQELAAIRGAEHRHDRAIEC